MIRMMADLTEDTNKVVHKNDPLDLVQGFLTKPVDSSLTLASASLKGIRDHDFKNKITLAIAGIADKGKLKYADLSTESKYEVYDDIQAIFEAIESGDSVRKLKGKISLYLWSLTEGDRERIFTRKLMSIYDELTEDAILALKFADDETLNVHRAASQNAYLSQLASTTGLGYQVFAQDALQELVDKRLAHGTYMDLRQSVLTEMGKTLKGRIEEFDIFDL